MISLAGGIVAFILGIIGLIIWWGSFIDVLAGVIPIMLLLGGALAAYLGFEEVKDKSSSESFDDTSDLKSEVETLKEEIKELKEERKAASEK